MLLPYHACDALMSDITLSVNELLKPYEASSLLRPKPYSLDHLNEFLKEAYQIVLPSSWFPLVMLCS